MPTPTYLVLLNAADQRATARTINDLDGREVTVHKLLMPNDSLTAEYLASHDAVLLFAPRSGAEDPFKWLPAGTDYSNVSLVLSEHTASFYPWPIPAGQRRLIVDDGHPPQVLRELLLARGPLLPAWLDLRVDPVLVEPTGLAWWNSDLLVGDTEAGCLFLLPSSGPAVHAMIGLEEPHQVALDRRRVMIANTGESVIAMGELQPKVGIRRQDDLEVPTDSIEGLALARPHGVWLGESVLAIADTDNQRVLLRLGREAREWRLIRGCENFVYPCGVTVFGTELWVTNSFIGAVDLFDLMERRKPQRLAPGPDLLQDPNAVVRWGDYVFFSDELRQRLVCARFDSMADPPLSEFRDVAHEWICSPWGLSINARNRLAIADRLLGGVWLMDLPRWLEDAPGGRW